MSKMSELAYDIEQLYIDGFSPSRIAKILECPVGIVFDWLESNNFGQDVEQEELDFDPFITVNS